MTDLPRTPAARLRRARNIAISAGLRHVYTGNIVDTEGGTSYCPGCRAALIVRDWHAILDYSLGDDGCCPHCGTRLAGRFEHFEQGFGRKRIPVRLAASGL